MRTESQTAWETAARCATLAQEADDPQEREHYERLRDAWTTGPALLRYHRFQLSPRYCLSVSRMSSV